MRKTRTDSSQQEAVTTALGCFKNLLILIIIETPTNGKMTPFVYLIRKHGKSVCGRDTFLYTEENSDIHDSWK